MAPVGRSRSRLQRLVYPVHPTTYIRQNVQALLKNGPFHVKFQSSSVGLKYIELIVRDPRIIPFEKHGASRGPKDVFHPRRERAGRIS